MTEINQTKKQHVTITLAEYIEYQELLDHKEEIRYKETISFFDNDDIQYANTYWDSKGALWNRLTAKLTNAGIRIEKLVQKNKELKAFNNANFIKRLFSSNPGKKND